MLSWLLNPASFENHDQTHTTFILRGTSALERKQHDRHEVMNRVSAADKMKFF